MYRTDGTGPIWRIIPNHVHAPDYQNATVIPIDVRQRKLDTLPGLVSEEFYNDVYGRYYNAPYNGQKSQFIKVTEVVDRHRKEKWDETFPALRDALNTTI
jgi:hypothetical protein